MKTTGDVGSYKNGLFEFYARRPVRSDGSNKSQSKKTTFFNVLTFKNILLS
ncbi:hypothetical protein [Leptospira santarosai]|uniref:hypothetical protein n=1 Tax=Leptospira santarosai TaxID=28183 RepID=UPI000A46CA79|nr:hypothetical protein [Leptospira santarosai]MBW9232741.1 hypothetical protein [Leptospira santarosai]